MTLIYSILVVSNIFTIILSILLQVSVVLGKLLGIWNQTLYSIHRGTLSLFHDTWLEDILY